MVEQEKLNLVVLDLDTFSGSECFMQATQSGASFVQGLRAYLDADYGRAAEEFRLALIAAYVEGDDLKAMVTPRDRAIIYLYIGNAMAFQENWSGALREYLNAVQADSSLAEAHYNIGVSFAAQGQLQKAISTFREALQHNPNLYEAKFALGRCHQAMNDFGSAYIYFQAARNCRPDAAEPVYHIGLMHHAHGAHDLAQECFAEALRVEPSFQIKKEQLNGATRSSEEQAVQWYYNLSEELKAQGQMDEVERIYRALLQWKPQETRARYLLGNLLARQKNWKQSLNQYRQIPPNTAEFIPASIRMSRIFRLFKKPNVAYHLLYQCIQHNNTHSEAFLELAKVLTELGRPDAALRCLRRAIQLNGHSTQALYLMGRLYLGLKQENQALAVWEKTLTLAPQLVGLHYDMGVIHLKRGRFQEAIRAFKSVLQHWEDDVETHYLLGLAFKESGDPTQAIPHFERVLFKNPDHTQALYFLGACHLQLGNTTVGIAYLQQYDRLLQQQTAPSHP